MKKQQTRIKLALVSFWCAGGSCGMIFGQLSVGHVSTYSILGWFFIGIGALVMTNTLLKQNEEEGYVMKLVKKSE